MKIKQIIAEEREEAYRIIDSFLVEAKNQNGKERSLERLNQDRHLAVERFSKSYSRLLEAQAKELMERVEGMKMLCEWCKKPVDVDCQHYHEAHNTALSRVQEIIRTSLNK